MDALGVECDTDNFHDTWMVLRVPPFLLSFSSATSGLERWGDITDKQKCPWLRQAFCLACHSCTSELRSAGLRILPFLHQDVLCSSLVGWRLRFVLACSSCRPLTSWTLMWTFRGLWAGRRGCFILWPMLPLPRRTVLRLIRRPTEAGLALLRRDWKAFWRSVLFVVKYGLVSFSLRPIVDKFALCEDWLLKFDDILSIWKIWRSNCVLNNRSFPYILITAESWFEFEFEFEFSS